MNNPMLLYRVSSHHSYCRNYPQLPCCRKYSPMFREEQVSYCRSCCRTFLLLYFRTNTAMYLLLAVPVRLSYPAVSRQTNFLSEVKADRQLQVPLPCRAYLPSYCHLIRQASYCQGLRRMPFEPQPAIHLFDYSLLPA